MSGSKLELARSLVAHHFVIEAGLERAFILDDGLDDPRQPLKLLEVNANTLPTGSIEPLAFPMTDDMPFVTEITEITPGEFDRLLAGELTLPPGWTLVRSEERRRLQSG